jgi:hypothetical protein
MTMDNMVNLIGVTVAAGVVTKVASSMFPQQQQAAPTRRRTTRKGKRPPVRQARAVQGHPGNFSNLF